MRDGDRWLLALPMFHVGCLSPTSLLVHRGGAGVIMRELEVGAMFRCIEQEKVTIFMAVPALLQFMLVAPERDQCDISSVRWIATGAIYGGAGPASVHASGAGAGPVRYLLGALDRHGCRTCAGFPAP